MTAPYDGGCLCGALRYRIEVEPSDSGYCHCVLCRRSTGAPVLAWATVPLTGFRMIKGEVARYPSSDHGLREFCRTCGTQLLYREAEAPTVVDINLGSLDEPDAIAPRCHIYESRRLSWFDTADELPRFAEAGPQNP